MFEAVYTSVYAILNFWCVCRYMGTSSVSWAMNALRHVLLKPWVNKKPGVAPNKVLLCLGMHCAKRFNMDLRVGCKFQGLVGAYTWEYNWTLCSFGCSFQVYITSWPWTALMLGLPICCSLWEYMNVVTAWWGYAVWMDIVSRREWFW